jgi:N-carbamoylputrescine amidase
MSPYIHSEQIREATFALIQMSCGTDPNENRGKAVAKIRMAAEQGAQVMVLQELFASQYFCVTENYDHFSLAETIPGTSTITFSELAKELGVVIVASLFEKRAQGLYHNTAIVIDADGEMVGLYRKMHIPDDPGYYEKFYFTPGDLGYKVFPTRFGRIGVLICWDQWYPEAARLTALKGADVLVYPTAIGWTQSQDPETNDEQHQAWHTIQRSHAVANGIPVLSVNRVGVEGDMQFWGQSFACNAFGKVLCQASEGKEEVLIQPINYSQSDAYRIHWPFLRDRRIDSYHPITKRFLDDES